MKELKKYEKQIKKLYDYMNHSYEDIENDYKHDYLTINNGLTIETKNIEYVIYVDETTAVAIRLDDEEILEKDEVEKILGADGIME